jgi:hypothetical protein
MPASVDDEPTLDVDAVTKEKTKATDPGNQEVIFSVIGGEDDENALDRVETYLNKDSRVESVVSETGRWYSVPDRDDLPIWIALRVYSREKDRDPLMNITRTFLADKIDVRLWVDYY